MEINRLTRKVRLDSKHNTIRYQLITELLFLRKLNVIDSDLSYLVLLIQWGPISLKEFCNKAVSYLYDDMNMERYPHRVQAVRNRIGMLEKRGLVTKDGKGKKTISFTSAIKIETEGNILLEYNFLYIETEESKGSDSKVGRAVATL